MTAEELIDLLSPHDTFKTVPRAEFEWLARHGTVRNLKAGDVVSAKGAQVDGMYIVLTGLIAIYVDRGAGLKRVTEWRAGDVTGVLPYSRLGSPPGDTVAQEDTSALRIAREDLREMTSACHEVTSNLVHTMLDRARLFQSSDLLDEKMASLGRLSARLAHELNNPVAAMERSAALLEDRLEDAERATMALGAARLTAEQLSAIESVRASCLAKKVQGVLSPLQQADREQAIADWLEDNGLPGEIAGPLSETSVTIPALEAIASAVEGESLDAVMRWAAAGCSVRGLASEIQDSALRISGLVNAVKGFTHMDRGQSAEPVSLPENLTNTVAVFRTEAKSRKIAIALDVEPGLPPVWGFVGQINQIFSNLIENAIDAVPEGGEVRVSAVRERGRVVVRVEDNGPGIPDDIRNRIFEPFFTTKPVGKGTGIGLDMVRRLLADNKGQVEVDSEPGHTEFRVSLPMAPQSAGAGAGTGAGS